MAGLFITAVAAALAFSAEDDHAAIFQAAGLPIPKFMQGIREPAAMYQHSREKQFSNIDVPFFDWYYIYVRDMKTRQRWAFTYAMSRCGKISPSDPCKFEGAWPGVVVMTPGHPAAGYTEKHPLTAWSASTTTQSASIIGADSSYLINATTTDGNHIHLRGLMNSTDRAWPHATGAQTKGAISWDLNLTRRAGWFGESWVEKIHGGEKTGAIMWSPYAHQATIKGSITIAGETVHLGEDEGRYRAYADSNWGSTMPTPPPQATDPINYPWGWYYATRPHADPAQDISIICGAGRTYLKTAGTIYGKLCDMRIGSKLRLSLWSWEFEKLFNRTASWASDSGLQGVHNFEITRSEWFAWKDEFGEAHVPMKQRIEIITATHNITMVYTATQNETGRLTFPLQDRLFSDFEALGATADVRIVERKVGGAVVTEFTDSMAGLEFGYRVPTKVPTA